MLVILGKELGSQKDGISQRSNRTVKTAKRARD